MNFHRARLRLATLGFALVAPLLLLAGARLRVNFTSPSAPRGLYFLRPRTLERGRLVLLCLPEPLGRLGRERGYLDAGACPGGAAAVLKRIVAVGGDEVEVSNDGISIDGVPVPGTARLAHDHLGRAIPHVPAGVYRLGPGEIWVLSRYVPNSWDSRYYGPLPATAVVAGASPLHLFDRSTSDW